MGDMLSQAEIDALLGGGASSDAPEPISQGGATASTDDRAAELQNLLTEEQKDVLGEIGNISMGTSATTLFTLLGQRVLITTPRVKALYWDMLSEGYQRPCVGIRVNYVEGIEGANILILKQRDVKIITSLMMGGDGIEGVDGELSEIDLSAIGEAMNQMVGSASTSLSSLIKMKIDIDTPKAFLLDFRDDDFLSHIEGIDGDPIVSVAFRMEIGTLIDSEIMQIVPYKFALQMVDTVKGEMFAGMGAPAKTAPVNEQPKAPVPTPPAQPVMQPQTQQPDTFQMPQQIQTDVYQMQMMQQQMQQLQQQLQQQQQMQMPQMQMPQVTPQFSQPAVNVTPVQFQSFDVTSAMQQKENIGIIMDVPLEISVELGRTIKPIKEILEFSPGTIIELDKLAGEPIDVLVNGKFIAKGEVVVIEENFCIRITDIINVENRI